MRCDVAGPAALARFAPGVLLSAMRGAKPSRVSVCAAAAMGFATLCAAVLCLPPPLALREAASVARLPCAFVAVAPACAIAAASTVNPARSAISSMASLKLGSHVPFASRVAAMDAANTAVIAPPPHAMARTRRSRSRSPSRHMPSAASSTSTSKIANPLRFVYELSTTNPLHTVVQTGNISELAITANRMPLASFARLLTAPFAKNTPSPTSANADMTMAGVLPCGFTPGKVPMQNRLGTASGLCDSPSDSTSDERPTSPPPLPPKSDSAVGSSTTRLAPTASSMVAAKRTHVASRRSRSCSARASSQKKYSTLNRHTM